MFKIYFTNFQCHTDMEFRNIFSALNCAKDKGFECQIGTDQKDIASWSPITGTKWYVDKLLTTKEAAFLLGLSSVRVNQFCQEGRMGKKFGKAWMIEISELEKFAQIERSTGVKRNV
jgi:hypothetical protein